MQRDAFRTVAAILDQSGIIWSVERCSKHERIVYQLGGRTIRQTISSNPRAARYAREELRRTMRRHGVAVPPTQGASP